MTSHDALSHPPVHIVGQLVDARLSLLDRQVVDVDGRPVGVLDDLELTDVASPLEPGTPPPEVTSLVHGPIVLERIFGGRRPDAHLLRIGWDAVAKLGPAIELAAPASELPTSWVESWLRDRVIVRIPGGRHVPR